MYGLLTAVVKEIKSLRGMFCVGNEQTSPPPVNFEVKSKTDPEIINIDSSPEPLQKKEVITLDFSASENKIVVSDDSDDDLSNDSDSESDSESDNDDESDNEEKPLEANVIQKIHVFENMDSTLEDIDVSFDLVDNVLDVSHSLLNTIEDDKSEIYENTPNQTNDVEEVSQNESVTEYLDNAKEQPITHVLTIEQLRKMNINQLKTIASKVGITADITKLKKPELISIILTGSN